MKNTLLLARCFGARVHNVLQAIAIQHLLLDDPNSAIKDNCVVQHLMDGRSYDIS